MKRRVLAALMSAGLFLPGAAFAALDGGVELVDRPTGFGPLPFDCINEASVDRHALSLDGCRVAIESNNDVLSALDDDVGGDIFSPSLSAEGKKVAVTTTARILLPPGTTVNHAVVVKNLDSGDVTVASRGSDSNGGTIAEAFKGVISGDGNAVAFRGDGAIEASNAAGVANEEDVYVRYLASGDTRMASVVNMSATRGGANGDF